MEQYSKNNIGMEFEGDSKIRNSYSTETPHMVQLVIKYSGGLIKNTNQANYVLFGFMVIIIIITLSLVFGGNNSEENLQPLDSMIRSSN